DWSSDVCSSDLALSLAAHAYPLLDGGALAAQIADHFFKMFVVEHHRVLSIIDDEGNLLARQTRVHGVTDQTDARGGVVNFQMAVGVPCQSCHAFAGLQAFLAQSQSQILNPVGKFKIAVAMKLAIIQSGNNLLLRVILYGVGEN